MGEPRVFVGNLSWGTDANSLRSIFSKFGTVTDSVVMVDRETGRSRGFGFVTFENETQCNEAISGMSEQQVDGRTVRVNMANQRSTGGGGGYTSGGGGG
ncbi:hypothetical protein HK097_007928, partial [Rhizophlyctis rosea]